MTHPDRVRRHYEDGWWLRPVLQREYLRKKEQRDHIYVQRTPLTRFHDPERVTDVDPRD